MRVQGWCGVLTMVAVACVWSSASAQDNDHCQSVTSGGAPSGTVVQREIIIVDRVRFSPGKSRIAKRYGRTLDSLAISLEENPRLKATVMGHADAGEPVGDLNALSSIRAHAVRDAIVARNIDPARVKVVAFGAAKPADAAPENNRRVEFKLVETVVLSGVVPFRGATPVSQLPIDELAQQLNRNGELQLHLTGGTACDERRTAQGHNHLGLKRAAEMRRALIARGVDPMRVSISGDSRRQGQSVGFSIRQEGLAARPQ